MLSKNAFGLPSRDNWSINGTRSDIPLREYTDKELAAFLETDRLDEAAKEIIDRFRSLGVVAGSPTNGDASVCPVGNN